MPSADDLRRTLGRIDGRGYKAYKQIQGSFEFPRFALHVDHVQGDPYATPSKLRVRMPMREAGLPPRDFVAWLQIFVLRLNRLLWRKQ